MILDTVIAQYEAQMAEARRQIETLRAAQTLINDNTLLINQLRTKILELQEQIDAMPPPDSPPVLPNPTDPTVPAPADILWRWSAQQVAPFGIHAKDPGRVSMVQAGGRPGIRLLTLPGDTNINGSNEAERCDLRLGNSESDAREGREWWFKHCIWFPTDYVDLPQSPLSGGWSWGSCMNWHDDADDGGSQGPLQMMMMPRTAISSDRPTGLHFQVYGGTFGNNRRGDFPVAAIERNMWYDLVYYVKWTANATGFAHGWVNGKKFMTYTGPTLHAGNGAYLKLANYHTPTGRPSAVIHGPAMRARVPLI